MGDTPPASLADASSRQALPLVDVDREFVRRVYDRCGGSLDVEVPGEEVGQRLGLDEGQTAEVIARLVRTGFLRDVAPQFRIKITIRGIALADREP